MRGIAGIIHLDSSPVSADALRAMINTMAICPTDRIATWCEGSGGLAHLVKIAIPEDRFEEQPITGGGGRFTLVTDAVLKNRDELTERFGWTQAEAAQLADSAFVRAAYEKWGEACVQKLEGNFAIAAWHPAERRLFAAVDALGVRPFYYWRSKSSLVFATTLRGLFSQPEISTALDEQVFAEGFAGFAQVAEDTLYRDIRRIPRGNILQATVDGVRVTRYWFPEQGGTLILRSDAEYQEAFRSEFTRAVKGGLRSSGEVGLLLSGGLDSSSVAAYAGKILAEQGRRLQAFHLLPTGEDRFTGELRELNESSYVEEIRRVSPHIDFHFYSHPAQRLLTASEQAVAFEDEQVPSHGLPVLADRLWQDFSSKHNVSVMLNGGGGNTIVSLETVSSGYLGYLAATGRWLTLASEIRGVHRRIGTPWRALARTAIAQSGWGRSASYSSSLYLPFLHPDLRARNQVEDRIREGRSAFMKLLTKDFRGALAYCLAEIMSQHRGVTSSAISRTVVRLQRSPMLDRRFNEFCLSVPLRQQLRRGDDRILLREAIRGLLPDNVRLRVTRGFPQPFHQNDFNHNRAEIMKRLNDVVRSPIASTYFDTSMINQLAGRISSGDSSPQDEIATGSIIYWHAFLNWRFAGS